MKMNKKAYMAPMVEIMNARVEKGFEVSGGNTNPGRPGTNPLSPIMPKENGNGVMTLD